ncbi:hypothetical protein K443DRAFT_685133 [Laccaria amethystina LaAM-08-1]|uniref:Uncharacterized protein n=1 Tax=Laccaria amethystina LaAM-08-1 TaxID=1095629 RepID=A0A0C9WIA7_9AGAR|nr:hypothetical protein K443DRAFT_685133 [Laccaria amethystina LaAM-08-1]
MLVKRTNKTPKAPKKDQTSKGRSFQLASGRPPHPAQRTPRMAAKNSSMPFGFSTRRWNIDVPHWGSTPKEGARVETANVVVYHHGDEAGRW